MLYRVAADAVLIAHAAFVLFAVFGGLLALRVPKLAWLHLPAVAWAALVELNGWICPLTPLEVALRRDAGDAGYAGDFIEHYLVAAIYPEGLTHEVQVALGTLIVLLNAAIYLVLWRRARRVAS